MARKHSDIDPHRLIHALSGTIAGICIGLGTGYVAMRATTDLLNTFVGSAYVGDGTTLVGFAIALVLGFQVGLFCSRSITGILRDAGVFTSWLFLVAFILMAILIMRQGYIIGLLPSK